MSSRSNAGAGDDGEEADRPRREVAYRLFAAEFEDASVSYSESDEERAPNYVVTPTGARVNRLFAVGVLTEVEHVNEDVLRGRIVDPTGAFVSYAGQYQPDEMAFLDRASPPAFVALSGKARTFQPDDSDRVFSSVRPESVSRVDADTRDRWTVSTAEATLERVGVAAAVLRSGLDSEELRAALDAAGVDESLAAGVPLALDHYGTTPAYLAALRRLALDALEVVAEERDSVRTLALDPADVGDGDVDLDGLAADLDLTSRASESADATSETATPTAETAGAELASEPIETPSAVEQPESSADEPIEETADTTTAADATSAADDTLGDFDAASAASEGTVDATPTEQGAADGPDEKSSSDDAGGPDVETAAAVNDDADGMYELDDEEREEVESEFGTEFSTGSEVAPAGEADIDVPSVDDLEDEPAAEAGTATDELTPGTTTEDESTAGESSPDDASAATGDDTDDDTEAGEDVDLESVAVEAMAELDDGDGASREAVVERVVDEYGVDPGVVEDAIQSALMSGQCYEPSEDSLKAI